MLFLPIFVRFGAFSPTLWENIPPHNYMRLKRLFLPFLGIVFFMRAFYAICIHCLGMHTRTYTRACEGVAPPRQPRQDPLPLQKFFFEISAPTLQNFFYFFSDPLLFFLIVLLITIAISYIVLVLLLLVYIYI